MSDQRSSPFGADDINEAIDKIRKEGFRVGGPPWQQGPDLAYPVTEPDGKRVVVCSELELLALAHGVITFDGIWERRLGKS